MDALRLNLGTLEIKSRLSTEADAIGQLAEPNACPLKVAVHPGRPMEPEVGQQRENERMEVACDRHFCQVQTQI